MELKALADVIIGVLVSREQVLDGTYSYSLFPMHYKDAPDYTITTKKDLSHKLTQEGDILFQLTYPNKVIYIDKKLENFLVTSQMCIIRPKKEIVNSIYLKWYLESEPCRAQIALNITGSSIKKISVMDLRNINIPCIPLDKQRKISDLIKLWNNEKQVLETIIEKKDLLYKNAILEIIEKDVKEAKK